MPGQISWRTYWVHARNALGTSPWKGPGSMNKPKPKPKNPTPANRGGARHAAGGVVGDVAELPPLVLLDHGEVVHQRHDRLCVRRQVQVAQQLLRVLPGGARHARFVFVFLGPFGSDPGFHPVGGGVHRHMPLPAPGDALAGALSASDTSRAGSPVRSPPPGKPPNIQNTRTPSDAGALVKVSALLHCRLSHTRPARSANAPATASAQGRRLTRYRLEASGYEMRRSMGTCECATQQYFSNTIAQNT